VPIHSSLQVAIPPDRPLGASFVRAALTKIKAGIVRSLEDTKRGVSCAHLLLLKHCPRINRAEQARAANPL